MNKQNWKPNSYIKERLYCLVIVSVRQNFGHILGNRAVARECGYISASYNVFNYVYACVS